MPEQLTYIIVLMKYRRHIRIQNHCATVNGWPHCHLEVLQHATVIEIDAVSIQPFVYSIFVLC